MIFNLDDQQEANKAFDYLTKLTGSHSLAEVRKLSSTRTLPQNRYLHLIISAFGEHFGYEPGEAKMVYKYLNKEVYRYKRHGITFWRSSADLSKEEMAQTIDLFRRKSAENGYELPEADDVAWVRQLQNELEARHRQTA